jgi:hypothetical protein
MKHRLVYTFGLIALGLVTLVASPAKAQTVAPGPYYATPSWDQTLPCTTVATCPRFIVLSNMNNEAVLDRETGVVWERSPIGIPGVPLTFHSIAGDVCNNKRTGGRFGWRLPNVQELTSLVDPSVPFPGLALPPGHPFIGIDTNENYWAANLGPENASPPTKASVVTFNGTPGEVTAQLNFTVTAHVWCVRGRQGVNP